MSIISDAIGPFSLIVFIVWYFFMRDNRVRKFYESLPSPVGVPFFGNALEFKSTKSLLPVLSKYTRTIGDLITVNIGPVRKFILVNDYKMLEAILSSTKVINKSINYNFLKPWLGTGLLTSDGPKWKKHRRIITPAFHFQILEQFIDVFEAGGNVFVRKLEDALSGHASRNSLNIYPLVTLCTLDIICESAMGTHVNAQDNADSEYVHSVKDMCRILVERSLSPIGQFDKLYALTRNARTQRRALSVLHAYTYSVIHRRRDELMNGSGEVDDVDNSCGIRKKKAFLDLLLGATVDGRPLTLEEIREEVDTFMFEGHDTTASAISFALHSLANSPAAQRKAIEEQVSLFGAEANPTVTYQDLQEMKYLEMAIRETLRLYPSVPVYARCTDQDVELNGIMVPSGVHLTIFAYGIQRDARYFPDPDTFDPSRFEDTNGKAPYAFIPFSAGPRNCIGQKFAMLEMKSTISKVLRNFELLPASPAHHLDLTAETVLKSNNGIHIGLRRRNLQQV